MSEETPQTTPSSRYHINWQATGIILAIMLVLIIAFLRYGLLAPEGSSHAATNVFQKDATAITTAPTGRDTGVGASDGTVISGATPYATAIIEGYPDPRVDTPEEQTMRAQYSGESKIIMVSLTGQFLQAFENGKLIRWTYITSGRPSLPTPTGYFRIFQKISPVDFIPLSTDPKSPLFGFPSFTQYGLQFAAGGYYIHDTWWRTVYGPGLTTWHIDPGREEYQEGSHGCVNTPLEFMTWIYLWAQIGTPVIVF
jgi:lipoprotein-anchoring transpeptidase ErfK/SrfK